MWGYLSDESIGSLDDATLEFNHNYTECPGGDRGEYTARECIAHVRRLRKKVKRTRTPIVHTCSAAAASHRDGLCTMPRIHEQASSTMVAIDNHSKMSLYGCMFAALSCLLGRREARPQMSKNSAWNPSIQPTHSPRALDESWRQVAHYLDEIHPSPSEPLLLTGAPPHPCCTLPGTLKDGPRRTYPFWPLGQCHPNPRQMKRVNAHCQMREYLRTRMARNEPVSQDFKTGLPSDWSRCFPPMILAAVFPK